MIYETACRELRAGRKRSDWMWFVFPQLSGLGKTPTSHRYAIAPRQEAEEYLAHPAPEPGPTTAPDTSRTPPRPRPTASPRGTDAG